MACAVILTHKLPCMKRKTILDVARRANVSTKTVSRVLNREPAVRPATRARIEEAMRELKYRPNSPARMLAGNRTYLVGLVYGSNSSYVSMLQDGAIAACREDHYDLLTYPCDYEHTSFAESFGEFLASPRVDGLVLTPPICDMPVVRRLLKRNAVPHVVVSRATASRAEWSVATDDREICASMVDHLVGLGHRRIAFVAGHADHKAMQHRLLGFEDGLHAAGIKAARSLIVQGDNTFASGRRSGSRLLDARRPPTAIFCANDHMAAGAMQAAHNLGLAIPGGLSIAGFDDLPIAGQIWPPLSTVRQPLRDMGYEAARLLLQRLHGASPDTCKIVVPSELVVRSSTGPVA